MCPEELLVLLSGLAIAIAKENSTELVAVYATAFTTLGDLLATYLAQCDYLTACCGCGSNEETSEAPIFR